MKIDHTTITLEWQEIVALMGLIRNRVGEIDINSHQYEIHAELIGNAYAKLSAGKDTIVKGWRKQEEDQ